MVIRFGSVLKTQTMLASITVELGTWLMTVQIEAEDEVTVEVVVKVLVAKAEVMDELFLVEREVAKELKMPSWLRRH